MKSKLEVLEEARNSAIKIKIREFDLERLEARVGIKAVRYDVEQMSGNSDPSKYTQNMLDYIEIKDKLVSEILQLEKSKIEARSIIDSFQKREQIEIMNYRYLEAMTVKEIANKMGYDKKNVYRIMQQCKLELIEKNRKK